MTRLGVGALALGLAFAAACTRPDPLIVTPREYRVQQAGAAWSRYAPADQQLIQSGRFRIGLDELALYLARGTPAFHWQTWTGREWCRALLYGGAQASAVEMVVYTCGGTIVHWAPVSPALPCWRFTPVARRIVKDANYFDRLKLTRQWEILTGILRRGQTGRDIAIAFGRPFNTGVEAREDGVDAQNRVFLDHSGEAYGLRITLVGDKVVGWRVPAERMLTPEAQAKRLQATEERLMAQLKKMEQQAQKQHEEEMLLLNQVQAQGQEILDRVAGSANQALGMQAAPTPAGGGETAGGPYERVERPGAAAGPGARPDGAGAAKRRTIMIKTAEGRMCEYSDASGGALGQICGSGMSVSTKSGKMKRVGPCPGGYVCVPTLKQRKGVLGACVPADQPGRCR